VLARKGTHETAAVENNVSFACMQPVRFQFSSVSDDVSNFLFAYTAGVIPGRLIISITDIAVFI